MPRERSAVDLGQLPRGPHGLSRETVERSQRERLLLGTAEAVAEKGYAGMAVADIISRAGVSRATFYQLYTDKHDCFLAASEMVSQQVAAMIRRGLTPPAGASSDDSLATIDRLLRIYLQTLIDHPVLARVFVVEVYAAGKEAVVQRRAVLNEFAQLLAGVIGDPEDPQTEMLAHVLISAVSSMVTNHVACGEVDELLDLHEPLVAVAERILGRVRA